jgi:hypothetical protein
VGRWLGALEARVLVNDLGLGWSGDGGYLYAGAAAYWASILDVLLSSLYTMG